jgi:hypothetical protein
LKRDREISIYSTDDVCSIAKKSRPFLCLCKFLLGSFYLLFGPAVKKSRPGEEGDLDGVDDLEESRLSGKQE